MSLTKVSYSMITGAPANVLDFGAVADGITDNTSAVQAAVDSLPTAGGLVYIPAAVKFNLKLLTFPEKFYISYVIGDDLSNANLPATTLNSGERVFFNSTSSYPTSLTGGVVNEWRFTAPFHPGFVTDVRKDLGSNIASYLGPGQTVDEPVRNSWNIADEQVDTFRVFYQNFLTPSNFSGVYINGWKRVVRLNGIGTAQWTSVPVAGTLVTGTTSGARGFVLTVDASYTDLLWFNGKFATGETVSDDNETTTATISSAVLTVGINSWSAQNLSTGAWTIGNHPPGVGTETLNISGNVRLAPTRGFGSTINMPKTVTNPAMVWTDNPEAVSPNQIGLMYPTSGTASLRRLQAVRQDLTTSTGAIAPVGAMVAFANTALVDTNAVNVASITNTATGKYTVTFTNSLVRALYIPSVSMDAFYMQNWWVGVTFRAVGSCEVWVKDNAGNFANIPAGAFVALTILGGDV